MSVVRHEWSITIAEAAGERGEALHKNDDHGGDDDPDDRSQQRKRWKHVWRPEADGGRVPPVYPRGGPTRRLMNAHRRRVSTSSTVDDRCLAFIMLRAVTDEEEENEERRRPARDHVGKVIAMKGQKRDRHRRARESRYAIIADLAAYARRARRGHESSMDPHEDVGSTGDRTQERARRRPASAATWRSPDAATGSRSDIVASKEERDDVVAWLPTMARDQRLADRARPERSSTSLRRCHDGHVTT